MKKSNIIISGSVAVVVLMAATGMAMTTLAAEDVVSSTTNTSSIEGHRPKFGFGKNLTLAQKQALQAKKVAQKTARENNRLAIQAALDLGDYDAWVKVVPKDSPILTKINKDNFQKLVEANKLMKQSNDIFKGLGIERGDMMGGKPQIHKGNIGRK